MPIPNFKSLDKWQKDDLFPGYDWPALTPKTLEAINDIVQNMLYDVDRKYEETLEET